MEKGGKFQLDVVKPDGSVLSAAVNEAVLPGHAPLLAALKTGPVWFRKGNDKTYAFIASGFAEVTADRVSVLATSAERAEDIDIARAEAAKRRAEERLSKPTQTDFDAERARIAMLRALTRLQVARQARTRG